MKVNQAPEKWPQMGRMRLILNMREVIQKSAVRKILHEERSRQQRNYLQTRWWHWPKKRWMKLYVRCFITRNVASDLQYITWLSRWCWTSFEKTWLENHYTPISPSSLTQTKQPRNCRGDCWDPPNFFYDAYCNFYQAWNGFHNGRQEMQHPITPKELVDSVLTFDEDSETLRSRSDSWSEEINLQKSSKRCLNRRNNKRSSKDVKRHSSPSNSLKERYETPSKTESEDGKHSSH